MTETPGFDIPTAHRYFSAHCFNRAWELIVKTGRTPAEDEEMLRLSLAATALDAARLHRPTCRSATGRPPAFMPCWVRPENARRYAQMCFEVSQQPGVKPFSWPTLTKPWREAEAAAGEKGYRLRLPDRGAPFGRTSGRGG